MHMVAPHAPETVPSRKPPPLGLIPNTLLFGGAALLLYLVTHGLIPTLAVRTSLEPVLLWFLLGGVGVFLPLVAAAHVLLLREAPPRPWWRDRMRFRPLTRSDGLWCLGAMLIIGLLSALSLAALKWRSAGVQLHPSFMSMEPLSAGRYWILAAWVPFWILNILGEEVLWRGVLLPRQEAAWGRRAWLLNGAGWLLFHLAFGPVILLTLWPITFILPYVVQRTRNAWTGVLIHAGLNGPGFVAVAFGLV